MTDTHSPDTLRAALTASLNQAGKTRTACAREAGIDGSNLSKFLNGTGRYVPTPDTWAKIASVLPGTDIADLFPDAAPTPQATKGNAPSPYIELTHKEIEPDPANYRKTFDNLDDFAEELAQDGILAPLIVRQVEGGYRLIAGERRWRAVGIAIEKGLWPEERPLPCTLKVVSEKEARALSIIENLQRQDVPRLEEAQGLYALHTEHGLTHDEIATRLGVSKRYVQQSANLITKLGPQGKAALEAGNINFEQARKLWTLPETAQVRTLEALQDDCDTEEAISCALDAHPPLEDALFATDAWNGETFKSDGKTYAVSAEMFEAAQQSAIKETLEHLQAEWAEVRTGSAFFSEWSFERTKDKRTGFAYVRIEPASPDRPWSLVTVYQGFRAKETKLPGKPETAADASEKPLELTQRQLIDAANLKTIMFQKAITHAPHRVPLAIATCEILTNLIGARGYNQPPSLLSLQRTPHEATPLLDQPAFATLRTFLAPMMADGIIVHEDYTGDNLDVLEFDWQTKVDRAALFDHLREHADLEHIFALCIALTTGCWPMSQAGEDTAAVAIADATGATLKDTWRMTDAYLTRFTIAGLHRVADVCGYTDPSLQGDRPATKAELMQWILDHPDRAAAWLPPELHFGYAHDVQAEVNAWLKPTATSQPDGAP